MQNVRRLSAMKSVAVLYEGVRLRAFADALCFADNQIEMRSTGFGPEGARAISSMLERNSTLTKLDISSEATLCNQSCCRDA